MASSTSKSPKSFSAACKHKSEHVTSFGAILREWIPVLFQTNLLLRRQNWDDPSCMQFPMVRMNRWHQCGWNGLSYSPRRCFTMLNKS